MKMSLLLLLGASVLWHSEAQFNNPPGVDIWCGKAYKSTDPSFDPGGWLNAPPKSATPLLNLQVYSRYNVYTESETEATIVVDAVINDEVGEPLCPNNATTMSAARTDSTWQLAIQDSIGKAVVDANLEGDTKGKEIKLSISDLTPRFEPYEFSVDTKTMTCDKTFQTKLQIYRLPTRTDGGTVVKLDRLYGGLLVDNGGILKPVFPYSFYIDWGGYLKYPGNQTAFAELGYNIVHPTPGGGDTPFEPDLFAAYVDKLDQIGQYLMYDMRWTFKNTSLVTSQVNNLKARKSLLLWYTADEPDGQQDPFNSTLAAYDIIQKLDPYHPTSLVLNCGNFHYDKYTRGADIIMTDPYPIAQNATFSKWGTVCNTTYGDCGCDNCNGNFRDVSTRLDHLKQYQHWLSNAPLGVASSDPARSAGGPKVFWGVPQVFGGSEYWTRPPSAKEEMVMVWLFINHGAKGIVGWTFPTTDELTQVTSAMAKLVTGDEMTNLLLGDNPRALDVKAGDGVDVDAAAWIVGSKMLVSVVYLGLIDTNSSITTKLPRNATAGTAKQVWPIVDIPVLRGQDQQVGEIVDEGTWSWPADRPALVWHVQGDEMTRAGLPAMAVSLMIMDIV